MINIFNEKWNYTFMGMALHMSGLSKDENTKVGSVVVGPQKEVRSEGYNGFPRGVNDEVPERHIRPRKYYYYEHAERNAIYNAGRFGVSLDGCTMYVTMPPCADCARAIIQSGIKHVYYLEPGADKVRTLPNGNWRDTVADSFEMLKEAGVEVTVLDRDLAIKNFSVLTKQIIERQK